MLERAGELAGVSMSGIEQATKDLTRRLSQAAAGTGPAVAALERLGLSASALLALPLDERVGRINQAILDFVPAAERAAVAGQLFGEEGSIAISRIDTGTLRQATEDVRDFGVVVSEQDADQIERTNDAISRLGLVWRGLSNQLAVAAAPALEAVADAMAALSRTTGPLGQAIRLLFDNIGRLASSAAAFAAFIAGRWVAGMVVAAASVRGLATALVFLRGALIRTGIGAVVVAAGELIYQFGRLVQASGGFGAALGLLGDVASEVWERIGILAEILQVRIGAAWSGIQARVAEALQGALEAVVSFGNRTVSTFQGAFDAMVVIWGNLPETIGDLTIRAANALIAGLEAMLNGAVGGINRLLESVNAGLAAIGVERPITLVPEIDLGPDRERGRRCRRSRWHGSQRSLRGRLRDQCLQRAGSRSFDGRGGCTRRLPIVPVTPRRRSASLPVRRLPPWRHCARRWPAPTRRSTTRQRRPSVSTPPSRRSAVRAAARQEKPEARPDPRRVLRKPAGPPVRRSARPRTRRRPGGPPFVTRWPATPTTRWTGARGWAMRSPARSAVPRMRSPAS